MLRRPPGEGRGHRKFLLAFTVLALPWLHFVDAQQQHQHPSDPSQAFSPQRLHSQADQQAASQHEQGIQIPVRDNWASTIDADASAATPQVRRRDSNPLPPLPESNNLNINNDKNVISEDARALQTVALDRAVLSGLSVRAPTPGHQHRPVARGSGGLSLHDARSLGDWEVEDFVLLATVDGHLHASDRKTGKERWHSVFPEPMVETKHFRDNISNSDSADNEVDNYIWVVEPIRGGELYVWRPATSGLEPGLFSMPFTMKSLVELSPFATEDPPVVYTGDKKTTMITIDAATGRILKQFGSGGSHVNTAESCIRSNAFTDMDAEECRSIGSITLGKTEYTVGIQRRDGQPIAQLKYSEWGPNNFDNDLIRNYTSTLDSRYIASRHDGKVYGFDYDRSDGRSHLFTEKYSAPVARVFDVCRPWDAEPESNPQLIVLPQPISTPFSRDETVAVMSKDRVFINQTIGGSWFAMSGSAYPLIIDAPLAQIARPDWWKLQPSLDGIDQDQIDKALVGTHTLGRLGWQSQHIPSLPAGPILNEPPAPVDPDNISTVPPPIATMEPEKPDFITTVKSIPQVAATSIVDFVKNPVLGLLFVLALLHYRKDLLGWYKGRSRKRLLGSVDELTDDETADAPLPAEKSDVVLEPVVEDHADEGAPEGAEPKAEGEVASRTVLVPDVTVESRNNQPAGEQTKEEIFEPEDTPTPVPTPGPIATPESNPTDIADMADPVDPIDPAPAPAEAPNPKKKAHRGRRGGKNHKKGKNKNDDGSQSRDDSRPGTVDEAVNNAMMIGSQARTIEPDVHTVANDMQAVSGPVIRIGRIEVDTDNQLGTGSNGTLVFAGKFEERDVAVKRMLIQFYDIASQETKLLRETDEHPNVIRYYAQEQRDGFLYIALKRCAASLADVVERPHVYSALAQAGKRDLPNVLYQITNGIHHLHGLRIVHRDLKPQNILVNMGGDGRPQLLVSDFGLCKKLDGGQSSFGATTGRAAGTSGWRAPELLLDDDARDGSSMTVGESTHSGSGSLVGSVDNLTGSRRATRAIDIFSLGLVFFYVLTNGSHPFDCGDRYMREVNIRKGNYSLDLLDSLGDFAFEAKDLIGAMLHKDPKMRPSTRDIMAHPFFWSAKKRLAFLCDVSDHFEKEPRDPPSEALQQLEDYAEGVISCDGHGKPDFLRNLPRDFIDSLGKQRKYTGGKMLDLLRALRNKRNHYEDMPETLKRQVGPLPDGYLAFWTVRFPSLLVACWEVVYKVQWDQTDRFWEYYEPAGL